MKIKLAYPVRSTLVLEQSWSQIIRGIEINLLSEAASVDRIEVLYEATPDDRLPTVKQGSAQHIALEIDAGSISRQIEIEEILRSFQGSINLFSLLEIDFDHVETEWIPEDDGEKSDLGLYSLSRTKSDHPAEENRILDFEIVSRAFAASAQIGEYEIPLTFLKNGRASLIKERYIQAFYDFFFFVETQFAPGFSNKREVKRKLREAKEFIDALDEAKSNLSMSIKPHEKRLAALLALGSGELIDHLVDVRGNLHHHSSGRPKWHPDRHHEFSSEAQFLHHVCGILALKKVMSIMYSDECGRTMHSMARAVGAIVSVRVLANAMDSEGRILSTDVIYNMPRLHIDKDILDHVKKEFFREFVDAYPAISLKRIIFCSEDLKDVYLELKSESV